MKWKLSAAIALMAAWPGLALADPIEGTWLAESGNLVSIAPCGEAYCLNVVSGPNKGKQIGRMQGADGSYKGTILNPDDDRSYSGSVTLTSGSTMRLKGCAMGIFCKTQNWQRQ
ncbi:DUF2147 domain-containing protein [Afifella pfennigii]|uniref:DUF2147 domain-containing protein n=1 Tax=Afifella pfennigii TaxID=209897 RepID=UPI000478DD36|nr:DUF2147 domain-containing protein [Afifella pfennigii]